jgi:hypothetical protein
LKRIIKERLEKRLLVEKVDKSAEQIETDLQILEKVFDSMFMSLINEIKNYATNVNEYIYFFTFLYEYYIEPLKGLTGD